MNRRSFIMSGVAVAAMPLPLKKKPKFYSLSAEVLKRERKDYEEIREAMRQMLKNDAIVKMMIEKHMKSIRR